MVGREFPDDPALRAAAPEQVVECPPGCLGYSTGYGKPVNDLIKDKLPVSVSLAIAAFVPLDLRRGPARDRGRPVQGQIARQVHRRARPWWRFAFPTFFIGLLLLKFVSIRWGLVALPVYTPLTENPVAVGDRDDPAGNHAGAGLHGRLHPDDARLRAGDDDRGLHPHSACQGAHQAGGHRQAHLAGGPDPPGDHGRARPGRPARRRDHHRDGVQLQRRRQAFDTPLSSATTCRSSSASCCCWHRS